MRRIGTFLAALTLLVACGGQSSSTNSDDASEASNTGANATIDRVVDGDTIVAIIDGQREKVRLIGIDTPETVKPDSPVECFGPEASAFTKSLLPEGTPIRIERDVEARDKYDRLLGYIYRADDGLFVNLEIIAKGYANLLTYPPNVAHVEEFKAAATAAREADLGLWAGCDG